MAELQVPLYVRDVIAVCSSPSLFSVGSEGSGDSCLFGKKVSFLPGNKFYNHSSTGGIYFGVGCGCEGGRAYVCLCTVLIPPVLEILLLVSLLLIKSYLKACGKIFLKMYLQRNKLFPKNTEV